MPRTISRQAHADMLSLKRDLVPVERTRTLDERAMVLDDATSGIEVDSETYEAPADGEVLTSEPATALPLARRSFPY